jgi:hypothetical protein
MTESNELYIEKVGDVNSEYPYLEVFFKDSNEPFMEIAVSNNQQPLFTIYPQNKSISLTLEELNKLILAGKDFVKSIIEDETFVSQNYF